MTICTMSIMDYDKKLVKKIFKNRNKDVSFVTVDYLKHTLVATWVESSTERCELISKTEPISEYLKKNNFTVREIEA